MVSRHAACKSLFLVDIIHACVDNQIALQGFQGEPKMHSAISIAALFLVASFAFGQEQTEVQKLLMDRHKKMLVRKIEVDGKERTTFSEASAEYLAKRKRGVGAVEDALAMHAVPVGKVKESYSWIVILQVYERYVAIEDMPDKVIPAFAHRLDFQTKNGSLSPTLLDQVVEFGPRGKAFLPTLERIRSQSTDEQTIRRVTDAISAIRK